MAIFDPLQNRHPLTDRQKTLSLVIMSEISRTVSNVVHIRPRGGGGFWANGWNVTKIYLFIYAPFGNSPIQVRPVHVFSRMMAQTMRTRARTWLLGSVDMVPRLWVKFPWNPSFGAWIGVFKTNSHNHKTCILSKLLHRFQPNFAQW